ncbi:MAG: hypothetical protein ACKESB_00005, partial [Candidatus Hodgkinia cicadicola]
SSTNSFTCRSVQLENLTASLAATEVPTRCSRSSWWPTTGFYSGRSVSKSSLSLRLQYVSCVRLVLVIWKLIWGCATLLSLV